MGKLAARIHRYEYEANEIVRSFPPRFRDQNKRTVYGLSSPPGSSHAGTLTFSRWQPAASLSTVENDGAIINHRPGHFRYETPEKDRISWHMNFAHCDLFCAYAGSLFAQDEMQVTEHPALASLRGVLLQENIPPLSVEGGIPTPALIMGVERRCIVHTEPDAASGRPRGLYGNYFSPASEAAVRKATEVLEPPTRSNILAMEAPAGGHGDYTREDITYVLSTAITGFAAAVSESERVGFLRENVEIHTGYWGCGAYGGNPVLMMLLQMIAARCVAVGSIYFYMGSSGDSDYRNALTIADILLPVNTSRGLGELVAEIESQKFSWGVSNGT